MDPNRSGYFNFRALAVVSRERFSRSGARKFKEVEVHCTEANVLQEDTFWLPCRSLEMEIWSPAREASMRVQNKIYEEHVKSFQGANRFVLSLTKFTQTYCQNPLEIFLCTQNNLFLCLKFVLSDSLEQMLKHHHLRAWLRVKNLKHQLPTPLSAANS